MGKRRERGAGIGPRIEVRGARQNNLKGIDVDIPLGALVVVTGPSGSGKSSLAFDTVYAEGQRRYVETFSPYTRQFLERMDKPRVDEIRGIPPAIALEQRNTVRTSRSTVGTITEVNDYLKLLYARAARCFGPDGREIVAETVETVAARAAAEFAAGPLLVAFPVAPGPRARAAEFFEFLRQQGYMRVWLDGALARTDEAPPRGGLPDDVVVVQDRIDRVSGEGRPRLVEAVEAAFRLGRGRVLLIDPAGGREWRGMRGWRDPETGEEIRPPTPGLFSFNHPLGACPHCKGFGRILSIDYDRVIPDPRLSLAGGAIRAFQGQVYRECQRDLLKACARRRIDVDAPFRALGAPEREFVIEGDPAAAGLEPEEVWRRKLWYGVRRFFDWLETQTYKMHVRVFLSRYRTGVPCPECGGGRYQPGTARFRLVTADGRSLTLADVSSMPVADLVSVFDSLPLAEGDRSAELLREQVATRLGFLDAVGLGYLTLDRATRTLSGGELQRANLTSCLGASLVNTLYVLDEPTVGLHPRDVGRLVEAMGRLRDKGNTLLVVEHEEAVIRAADQVIDLGPGRGDAGGDLVYSGDLEGLTRARGSLTGDYLSGRRSIPVPASRRGGRGRLRIDGARAHNLRNVTVEIPLGTLVCVTGVSGSGKSTLVDHVLYRNLQRLRGETAEEGAGACRRLVGASLVGAVVMVDQSPLSRTPRSTAALYVGAFDAIRKRFADLPEARAAGLRVSDFSFNSGAGRCERCGGAGFEKVEMQFLSDVHVRCPECEGRRFQPPVLAVRMEGRSVHDVLEMTVDEAVAFFDPSGEAPEIGRPLRALADVGLGYLRLGQPLNALSGGESQRLKLVGHLVGRAAGDGGAGDLLLFDEPTTGLHFDDIAGLIRVFDRLADAGHTPVVIEHNLDVIKCADHVIDLGPEAGAGGGRVVAIGTPEQVAAVEGSHTGRALRAALGARARRSRAARVAEAPPPAIARVSARGGAGAIEIRGAREHNLKGIDLRIPRDRLVIVTGLSGSGKSTLAFDILFAEGQRRFLDSMSLYARQYVEQMEKPDVDHVDGLPPSVAIEQRVTGGGGKSTVATVTEIYHFLRLLFAKLGTQHCPACGVPVERQSVGAIAATLERAAREGRVRVLAPLVKARKGFHTEVADWARRQGFDTLMIDGRAMPVEGFQRLERYREHTIDVVVGEITGRTVAKARNLTERALRFGRGTAKLLDARGRVRVVSTEMACPGCGTAFEELDPRLFSFHSPHGWCERCRGYGIESGADAAPGAASGSDERGEGGESVLERELREERARDAADAEREGAPAPCARCGGSRINDVARAVRLGEWTIDRLVRMGVGEARGVFGGMRFPGRAGLISRDILPEIGRRLEFMERVGLGYLALDRGVRTLSGGEAQRIRLAAQLGSNLRGVLYVLDEPTIGLHPRDNERLLESLEELRAKGNSLVVVEHDEETIRRADHVIDLGPGAGAGGGRVVAQGSVREIERDRESVTGRYLRRRATHPLRGARRTLADAPGWLEIEGARANNLRAVDVRFPLGRLSVITGVSGSGKSSLMRDVLRRAAERALARGARGRAGEGAGAAWRAVRGCERLRMVYEVDQTPIGKTSRSTPATYTKVFDEIRRLYAELPASRMRGYAPGRFSFNAEGGRCETCLGQGAIRVEMNFLPASWVPCPDCHGARFNAQTLEILYSGKTIGDVMEMTVEEARALFDAHPSIRRTLSLLCDTGLGYLKLGQPSPTLSGGEAQRIKLVSELARGGGGRRGAVAGAAGRGALYLLEEPTIGLHAADVERLLEVIHRLVDGGNTVIAIEHNLGFIAEADYIVDIGPDAGADGGTVVACGEPERVARSRRSRTAPFLRELLARKPRPR